MAQPLGRWMHVEGHVRFVVFVDDDAEPRGVVDIPCTERETLGAATERTVLGVDAGLDRVVCTIHSTLIDEGERLLDAKRATQEYAGGVIVLHLVTCERV